jgi:hypothetical protein
MYMKMAQILSDGRIIYQDSVVRLLDNATIPFVEGNKDYHEYLEWLETGNEPVEFEIELLQGSN